MVIRVNVDVVLAQSRMKSKELAEVIGISIQNLSILKTGKTRTIRFTKQEAICRHLEYQAGDLLGYRPDSQSRK